MVAPEGGVQRAVLFVCSGHRDEDAWRNATLADLTVFDSDNAPAESEATRTVQVRLQRFVGTKPTNAVKLTRTDRLVPRQSPLDARGPASFLTQIVHLALRCQHIGLMRLIARYDEMKEQVKNDACVGRFCRMHGWLKCDLNLNTLLIFGCITPISFTGVCCLLCAVALHPFIAVYCWLLTFTYSTTNVCYWLLLVVALHLFHYVYC